MLEVTAQKKRSSAFPLRALLIWNTGAKTEKNCENQVGETEKQTVCQRD